MGARLCTAVGYMCPTGAIAESLRLSRWSLSTTPSRYATDLADLSCPSTGWCLAVGQAPGPCCRVVMEELAGNRWAMAPAPLVPFEENPAVQLRVHGVSCPDTGSCLLVGSDVVSGASTVVERVIERRWPVGGR